MFWLWISEVSVRGWVAPCTGGRSVEGRKRSPHGGLEAERKGTPR